MLSGNDIQRAYIDLYKEMRRYLWSYEAIRTLAMLEVAIYNRFPILADIRSYAIVLRSMASNTTYDDPEVMSKIDDLLKLLDDSSDDCIYSLVPNVQEV